jgi:hypothetical protein
VTLRHPNSHRGDEGSIEWRAKCGDFRKTPMSPAPDLLALAKLPATAIVSNRASLLARDVLQAGDQISSQIGFRQEIFNCKRVRKLPH